MVGRSLAGRLPLKRTTAPDTNPLPLIVSVKAGPAAETLLGDRPKITGTGLVMLKFKLLDAPAPGLLTLTVAVPEL